MGTLQSSYQIYQMKANDTVSNYKILDKFSGKIISQELNITH